MYSEGTIIGQYRVVEQIGKGGMAIVYKAFQPNLDRYVAIKVLTPGVGEDKGVIARFEREARSVAKLRHRNILTVFDYGCYQDSFYLVMEYVSGGTLQEHLGWPQDLAHVVNVISQVGNALAYAHSQGVIHRDVKPANILLAETDWPLLSDFGLARMLEDSLHLTASGASVGTPKYMSPEQAQGLTVDRRSDIYSLGVVLYEAVTGRPPFGTDSPMAVILRHISEPVTPPRALRSDLPKEMETVILRALAKSPSDRYQRMEEFLANLQAGCPLPTSRGAVYGGNARTGPNEPPATFRRSLTKTTRPRLPGRWSSLWTKVGVAVVLLLAVALVLLAFKGQAALSALFLPRPESTVVLPDPSVVAPSPTPVQPSPTTVLPSPTVVPPSPTVEPTVPVLPTIVVQVWQADGVEMALVPAGEFVMGSEELGEDERPVHQVYVDSFWIDRYEVTNERFARFVDATSYQTEAEKRGWGWVWQGSEWKRVEDANWQHPHGPDSGIAGKMDHPVVLVSWNDAEAYCRWVGKRLPSEAQWEKAARGPALGSGDSRRYAWGDEFDSTRANTSELGLGDTTPVGSFSPQGDSLYAVSDMTGNVWEWVADWYSSDYYSQSAAVNPTGPFSGTFKVMRGGSWSFDEFYARTAFRRDVRPDYTYDFVGFRCSVQQER